MFTTKIMELKSKLNIQKSKNKMEHIEIKRRIETGINDQNKKINALLEHFNLNIVDIFKWNSSDIGYCVIKKQKDIEYYKNKPFEFIKDFVNIDLKDKEHLQFIYLRLVKVHGENNQVDYMQKFNDIINKI